MPLVNSAVLYEHAQKDRYVVAGFDSYCLEVIQAHVIAANEENSPFLLQVTPKGLRHIGINYFTGMAKVLIQESNVPVAVHLDHGTTFEQVTECIKNGFTSVMIDGSALSFKKNIELTKKVVEIAHPANVTVEAELGRVLGKESDIDVKDDEDTMTDPEAAGEFVEKTGVDSLAVSVGTVHGFYKSEPVIDYERLDKISKETGIHLIFHGGSGLGKEVVEKASALGVRKINIGTLIKHAFTSGIKEFIRNHPEEIDPRKVLSPAREKIVEELKKTIQMFGSSNKNWI